MKPINLQDPFQGRRWLNLVEPDEACGFRLKRNFSVAADELGFSYATNRLGLHGPCDEEAPNVVFGTSYAMGIGVDEGHNWHDLALPRAGWLNLGLAVGIREWSELVRMHHRGPKQRAVLLYHPNIWAHCLMYERWRASGGDVFAALNWRRDMPGCIKISWRRWRVLPGKIRRGEIIRFDRDGNQYVVDALYTRIRPQDHPDLIERNLRLLRELLVPFSEILCIRVPIKQELVPNHYQNAILRETVGTYEALWRRTVLELGTLPQFRVYEPMEFNLSHYHPQDSHWNASGNAHFAGWLGRSGVEGCFHSPNDLRAKCSLLGRGRHDADAGS